MIKNSLKTLLFAFAVVISASCDNDFNVLGTDLVGVDNFGFGTPVTYDITTSNVDLSPVQSTNLPLNPLGIYNNTVFGETKANFVTQVLLKNENPLIDLAKAPEIVSVVLRIPYFTKSTAPPFTLDSIYGPSNPYSKMKLSVYESGYFIRDLNPVDQLTQAYYTDQNQLFEQEVVGSRLNDDADLSQNDEFTVSNAATTTTTYNSAGEPTTNNDSAPAISLNLSKDYFTNKILNAPAGKLLNNNIFRDYFRGLYFKVEKNGSNPGNLAMLNFRGGTVTIYYKENLTPATPENPTPTKVFKSIDLNLTGKSVSLIEQAGRNVPNDNGDLFVKGGAGQSMAVIDIKSSDIEQIKSSNWLINDASITFKVNKDKMSFGDPKAVEPFRVYLYDLTNKRQLIDYSIDQTSYSANVKLNKYVFGGIIDKDPDGRGRSYKIRLTNHIRELLKTDTLNKANVRLGLVVTETINDLTTIDAKRRLKTPVQVSNNPNSPNPFTIKTVPTMTVVHPLGTILFGSDNPDYDKRPKLQIYYTQLKQN